MSEPTAFTLRVMSFVRRIPKGKVATYKQIAELSGKPQGSRGVAWILNSCSKKYRLPWHRVLSSKGKIAFPPLTHHFNSQKRLLKKEGVEFFSNDYIDMGKYQWKKMAKAARKRNQPRMFS
jgi:methylated-DNA-protein-cysteine methyltransferase-like protein